MGPVVRKAAAILEIIAVFVAGALLSRLLPEGWRALTRIVLILAVAAIVDLILRRHRPSRWGLKLSSSSGILFLVAMAWQGWLWSTERSANGSVLPLVLAHGALLALYRFNP